MKNNKKTYNVDYFSTVYLYWPVKDGKIVLFQLSGVQFVWTHIYTQSMLRFLL